MLGCGCCCEGAVCHLLFGIGCRVLRRTGTVSWQVHGAEHMQVLLSSSASPMAWSYHECELASSWHILVCASWLLLCCNAFALHNAYINSSCCIHEAAWLYRTVMYLGCLQAVTAEDQGNGQGPAYRCSYQYVKQHTGSCSAPRSVAFQHLA